MAKTSSQRVLLAKLSGFWGVLIGITVIIGWYAHWASVVQVLPSLPPMKFNTALSFIICGLALLSLNTRLAELTSCLGGVVTLIGSITLAEYLTGQSYGIDQLLFKDYITFDTAYPGRMSPLAASCFVLFGSALILTLPGQSSRRRLTGIGILTCMVAMIVCVAIAGFAFGIDTAYGWGAYTRMALHTAITFLALSTSLLYWARHEAKRIHFDFTHWLPLTASVTLMVMVAIVSLASFTQLQNSDAWRKHSADVLIKTQVFLGDISDVQSGMRGYVLTGQSTALVTYRSGASDGPQQLARLQALTQDNRGQVERLKTLAADFAGLVGYSSKLIGVRDSQGIQAAIAIEATGEGFNATNQTVADLHAFTDAEQQLLAARSGTSQLNSRNTQRVLICGGGLSIVLLLMANLLAGREMRRRSQTETRLREVASFQEAILDSTNYAIVTTDVRGVVTSFNSTAEKWLGFRADEIVGKSTPAIWHDASEIAARAKVLTKELGRNIEPGFDVFTAKVVVGKTDETEWMLTRKNGSRFPSGLSATALTDLSGKIIGYLGVLSDLTERKNAEKKLRDQALILDLANDTIFIRDKEDRITYWNQGAERLYEWTKEEAVGKVTHELFKTQFPYPLEEIKSQLLREGFWKGELLHQRRDGTSVHVSSSWTVQRDSSGTPIATIETNFDITARRKAEQELVNSRRHLNAILNSSLDGIIVYESVRDQSGALCDLRFTMVNPASERLMQIDRSGLLGQSLLEKFPTVKADGLFDRFAQIVEKNTTLDFEHLSHRTEPPRWYRMAGAKLGDGLVVSYTDISVRKQYEKQLQEAKVQAEQADRAKSDFLANMSHEIRTPMNGVIGMTGLLLDTPLDPEQHNLAETIRASADSLLSLINDILDFSKIEAGKLTFEELDFDLRKVIEDTLEILAGQAQAKGNELIGSIDPEVVTKLRGDPGRIHQVLTNLIGNAIKFTKNGEVVVHATRESETAASFVVRVEIKDSGIGIPPEIQAQLFQPFVQADGSTSRKFGGTGLGLAICKRLVESMGGAIGVRSAPGEGSIFWVTMKFERQPEVPAEPQLISEFLDTKVLIVDDNETSRQFLQSQVGAWRIHNEAASSAGQALTLLQKAAVDGAPYQLAIIDLQMPGMDGLELLRQIHAETKLNATRTILLTPMGKAPASAELKKVKVTACCAKPIRQSALFDCMAQALNPSSVAAAKSQPLEPFVRAKRPVPVRKERVLLAEDNAVNQQVALGNLRKLGYTADVVSNGMEVLEVLESKTYDIILMDCQMPELDGYQTTEEIRRREKNGHRTRIIAMTANVMVGDRERCLSAGMDDYVSKPLRRAELRDAMERGGVAAASPIDDSVLEDTGMDKEEIAELIELFSATAPQSILEMKQAFADADSKKLAMAAHTLKGSCGNLGATSLREICAKVEEIGRADTVEGAEPFIGKADEELSRFIDALKARSQPKHSA